MPNLRLRLASVAALSAILLSSCSVIGGGGGKETKLTAWFPKTIALFPASEVRVLGLPAGKVTKVTAMGDQVKVEFNVKHSVPVRADVHWSRMSVSRPMRWLPSTHFCVESVNVYGDS